MKITAALLLTALALFKLTEAQIGLLCTKNSDCNQSSSYVCGPKKSCVCDRGHKFDLLKFSCLRFLVNQKGRCNPDQDICKGGPNAECSSTFLGEKAICKCKPGFDFDYATELCKSPGFVTEGQNGNNNNNNAVPPSTSKPPSGVLPGEACNQNSDCRFFPNATCYYFVDSSKRECNCNYDTHYYDSGRKVCLPKKEMGAPCDGVNECVNLSNIECSNVLQNTKTKKCSCKMDYYYHKGSQECSPTLEIGEECTFNEQCKAQPNSYCNKHASKPSRCACLPGKLFYKGSRTCVEDPGSGKLIAQGHPCMPGSKCEGGPNAVCRNTFIGMNPVCTCKDGFEFDRTAKVCRDEGGSSSNNNNNSENEIIPNEPTNDTNNSNNNNNINIDLKFNVRLEVTCDSHGKCKTSKATIEESKS